MSNEETKRDGFKSKWGFILACIGSAVGMANIWRFPYMVATYGGLTFLLPYFLFVVLIGASGVMEEFSLGRWGGAGPVGSFGRAMEDGGKSKRVGEVIGALPVIGSMGLAIGYSVVMGWIFKYTKMSITGEMFKMGQDMNVIGGTFGAAAPESGSLGEGISMMLQNGIFGIGNGFWIIVAIVVSVIIMALGVAGGIEKACKIMIPMLFGLFLIMAVYIAFLPGASDGYKFIFSLDPSGLADIKLWVFAFGQAFFSLSVAGNGSVIYGSYLGKDVEISSSARNVAVFDTLAALVAMFVIIPAMATTGSEVGSAGPGLMFVSLPSVFNGMGAFGWAIGAFFFIAVLFAGTTSIINLYETPVAFLQEKFNLGRLPSVIIIHAIGLVVALLIQPWTSQWMDMVSIYICPFGAMLAGIMFFWVMKKKTALDAVNQGARKEIGSWFYVFGKYAYVPLCLLALIFGIYYGGIG
ncbi:sodium-dependent transporter [Agathobaculum sp. Marseille-P7918]|uniref:sodium-dependent transporter n=1 Tax=Agathobaculum sp. Marseille-P7918 TaxID=2479843 RepID=UPI000F640044|nr:sodium-dependent transporter [Agathobaculum sp. Marseille-P7918]